jgi:hypothetical protein
VESNTPGTPTNFGDGLVDFDYDIWKKFGLKLYWPEEKGKLGVVWPMRILAIREHPVYQMIGLVKKDNIEEVVTFSKNHGKDSTGVCALMDLDSLMYEMLRANTTRSIVWQTIKLVLNIIRMIVMMVQRCLKRKIHEYREQKSST